MYMYTLWMRLDFTVLGIGDELGVFENVHSLGVWGLRLGIRVRGFWLKLKEGLRFRLSVLFFMERLFGLMIQDLRI